MPSKDAHLKAVFHNTSVIQYLLASPEPTPQWLTTLAFYKALHIVEAVFTSDTKAPIPHADSHEQRNKVLKNTPRYIPLWKHYRELWNDSLVARYLTSCGEKEAYADFADYLTVDEFKSKHLKHHMVKIIQMARSLTGDDSLLSTEC